MKTNLLNVFNAISLFTFNYTTHIKAQSVSDVIIENQSLNHTFVLNAEVSQGAWCDYNPCKQVLAPEDPQYNKEWIAFSEKDSVEKITYDVCRSTGADSVVVINGVPKCADSAGQINVISRPNNVTALALDKSVEIVSVKKVWENDTGSNACYEVYQIKVAVLPYQIFSTEFPRVSLRGSSENSVPLNKIYQCILYGALFSFITSSLMLGLFAKEHCASWKQKELMGQKKVGENCCGCFSSSFIRESSEVREPLLTESL